MSSPTPPVPTLEERLRRLEAEVERLRESLAALDRSRSSSEHPIDQKITRSKVTYDWQS